MSATSHPPHHYQLISADISVERVDNMEILDIGLKDVSCIKASVHCSGCRALPGAHTPND